MSKVELEEVQEPQDNIDHMVEDKPNLVLWRFSKECHEPKKYNFLHIKDNDVTII